MKIRIPAKQRTEFGKNANNRLRVAGTVPVNMLLPEENQALALIATVNDIRKVVNSGSHLIELEIEGVGVRQAFLKKVVYDSLRDTMLHVDLLEAKSDRAIIAKIPFLFRGTPVGVAGGGVFTVMINALEVSGFPQDIPDSLTIEIAKLNINDAITVGDLTLAEALTVRTKKEQRICVVHIPTRVVTPTPAEAEAAAAEAAEAAAAEGAEGEAAPADGKGAGKTPAAPAADAKGAKGSEKGKK